ncbi:MAG: Ldh family oxidoreductase [Chloroflexi bacterium]|nr:Ldh family oxidoreductase [Chloroflexota bacterium]
MIPETIHVPVNTMRQFMEEVFTKIGVPANEAKICADVLIASDLRGIESHGVQRLKMYYDRIKTGQQKAVTDFEIVRESPTTAVVDGHHGMGMVIGTRSMQMAIDKAKQYGMGSVAVRNSTHFGIDGYYARMAINQGLIGMSFTNARPSISPTFGVQPLLGTNPIAFGAPTDEDCPFLFDAATSIIQRGKVEVYNRIDKPIPPGWVTGADGKPMTNAAEILAALPKDKAALLPLGGPGEELSGYKGYGLATIVEILCASLQTGAYLSDLLGFDKNGNKQPFMVGHFFMAINIENFVDLETFKKTTGDILRTLRESTKVPGEDRIYTAGEKEYELEHIVPLEGIAVVPSIQKDIIAIQKELGLDYPFQI